MRSALVLPTSEESAEMRRVGVGEDGTWSEFWTILLDDFSPFIGRCFAISMEGSELPDIGVGPSIGAWVLFDVASGVGG